MHIPKYVLQVLDNAIGRYGDLAHQFGRNLDVNGDRLTDDEVKAMQDRITDYNHRSSVIKEFISDAEDK